MRPTSCCRRGLSAAFVALAIAAVAPAAAGAAPGSTAPGAPGAKALWTPADKQGFGTSMTTQSKVWHTLAGRRADRGLLPRPRARRRCATCSSSSPTARPSPIARPTRRPTRRAGRQAQPHLPPGQHGEVGPLPDRQDLRHRPLAQHAAGRRALPVAHRPPVPGLRLRRPVAQQRRQRRLGHHGPRRAADPGRPGGQRARRRAVLRPHLDGLPGRQRRLGRPARRPPDGLALPLLAERQRRPDRADAARRRAAISTCSSRWASARRARGARAPRAPRCSAASAASPAPTPTAGTATWAR